MPNTTRSNCTRISKLPVFVNESELLKFLENGFTDSLKQFIRLMIKTMMKEEMNKFRQEADSLMGKLYFNGYYPRNMLSSMGEVKGVSVPRFRNKPEGWEPKTLGIFNTEQDKFMKLVEQMHLLGISQRKIRHLMKTCLGVTVSANRVGKIYQSLAKQEEININSQALDDNYEYILADGLWSKVKGYGWDNNKGVLLCVLGIRPDGKRKVIGFSVERSESYQNWHKMLAAIKQRGFKGKKLKLVIADGEPALHSAARQLFPKVFIQSCIVHKMRNVIGKTRRKYKANRLKCKKRLLKTTFLPVVLLKSGCKISSMKKIISFLHTLSAARIVDLKVKRTAGGLAANAIGV